MLSCWETKFPLVEDIWSWTLPYCCSLHLYLLIILLHPFCSLLLFALTLLWFSLLVSLLLPSLPFPPLYHNPCPLASFFLLTHFFFHFFFLFLSSFPLLYTIQLIKLRIQKKKSYFLNLGAIFTHSWTLSLRTVFTKRLSEAILWATGVFW